MSTLGGSTGSSLVGAVVRGWRWWMAELRGMVPPSLSLSLGSRGRSEIWVTRSSLILDRYVGRRAERYEEPIAIEAVDQASWDQLADLTAGTATRIVLAAPDIHTLTCKLPKAARAHLRSAVALQLNELSPVEPALVDWALHPTRKCGDSLEVPVTLVKKGRLDQLVALFEEHEFGRLAVYGFANEQMVRLAAGSGRMRERGGALKVTVAILLLLASIPATTILAATWMTHANDRASDALEVDLAPKLLADRRARTDENNRTMLVALTAQPSATDTLVALATAMPLKSWASTIERRPDGSLAMTAITSDPDELRAAPRQNGLTSTLREINRAPAEDRHTRVDYQAGG